MNNSFSIGGIIIAEAFHNQEHFRDYQRFLRECDGDPKLAKMLAQMKDLRPIWTERCKNGVTTAGLNSILEVYFRSGTQLTTWYFGLIDNASFSALAAADTMSSHAGWIENIQYSTPSARKAYNPGAASGGVIINGTAASFTMSASATIKGAFVCSDANTSPGTAGTLWATGAFASNQSLISGQILGLKYSLTATGS